MDALDSYQSDRYFEGGSSASIPPLSSTFSSARVFSIINYNDPNTVLNAFDEAFNASNASVVKVDGGEFIYGGYTHFIQYDKGEGKSFKNEITYNKNRSYEQNIVSQIHEKFHAIQWTKIPELHAIPQNMFAYQEMPIILSPRSWILANLLTEREAYAKTAWIAMLMDENSHSDALETAMQSELVKPKDIRHWHSRYPDDIGFALGEASLIWDNLIRARRRGDGSQINLRDHYIEFAIRQYNEKNCSRLHSWETAADPVFIDLDDDAILALGSSFGPSIFGKYYPDPVFKDLKLTPEQEVQVRALEEKFGIQPGQKLPTLRQELTKRGMSVDEYMHRSKTFIDRPPLIEQKQELVMTL